MKVAHFGHFAPYGAGMFHSICEQILAERLVGIDSQFIDWTAENPIDGQYFSRVGLSYDGVQTISPDWAKNCDILVRHSAIPNDIKNIGTPIVMVLHGRPAYSFMLEYTGQGPIFSHMQGYAADSQYKAFLVLGEEYVNIWSQILETKATIQNLPLMVDLKKYNPWGSKQELGDAGGSPNIIIADRWRRDVIPFYLILAAAKFIKEKCPTAKLHCFALPDPNKNACVKAIIAPLIKQGIIGKSFTIVKNMTNLYRTADFLLTPNNVTNRIIRESLASGCPIMAAPGCRYTDYTAFPGDMDGCVKEISRLWEDIQADPIGMKERARKLAEESFSFEKTGAVALKVYEDVLKEEQKKPKEASGWTGDTIQSRNYTSYQNYLSHQASKLDQGIDFLENYDKKYREGLGERLSNLDFIKGSNVICLGARIGTEVKAFIDNDALAFGIDLNPGKGNKYVVTGDFHDLQYADGIIDIAFTNCLDHVFDITKVLNEVYRILKTGGKFIIDIEKHTDVGIDKWSSFWWKNTDELIKLLEDNGFICIDKKSISCMWFIEQLIFEKKKER